MQIAGPGITWTAGAARAAYGAVTEQPLPCRRRIPRRHPRRNGGLRRPLIAALGLRLLAYGGLGLIWLPALAFHAPGYMLFPHVMRFMNAYQHSCEPAVVGGRAELAGRIRPTRQFEELHTCAKPAPLLNLVTLNIGYHHARDHRPAQPWYRLPALHRGLYGDARARTLPYPSLLRNHHRIRLRVLPGDHGVTDARCADALAFRGAPGMPFFTRS